MPDLYRPDEAVACGAAIIGNNILFQQRISEQMERSGNSGSFMDADEKDLDAIAADTGFDIDVVRNAKQTIRNVASKTFGEAVFWTQYGETRISNLIYKNTQLPCSAEKEFYTRYYNQTTCATEIYENYATESQSKEGYPVESSVLLASKDLPCPPGLPSNSPVISRFDMTAEGLLIVTATEPSSNNSITIHIDTTKIQNPEEREKQRKRCAELIVE